MKTGRSTFSLVGAVSVFLGALCPSLYASTEEQRPNFVFILSDDQGWTDVEWRTPGIPTPNLNKLRKSGVELAAHYTAPTCSPTRAALLTGRYWSRFGIVVPNSQQCLPDGTDTIASLLKKNGYATALIGKWHLGGVDLPDKRPSAFGFDYSYGCLDGHGHVYTHEYTPGGRGERGKKTWHRNGKLIEEEGHITDLIGNEAVQFVERNKDRPFFLYLPFTAPHRLCIEPEEWLKKVDVFEKRRPYAAMITHMDAAIGRVMDKLDQLDLRENTLIVFASDNGGASGEGIDHPFRGGKSSVYEGGIRNLCLVSRPGTIPPGQTLDAPVTVTDWLPTIADASGMSLDASLKLDGRSVWEYLTGESRWMSPRPVYVLGTSGKSYALREGKWKLVRQKAKQGESIELYDLDADPSEKKNVARDQPKVVQSLMEKSAKVRERDRDAVCRHIGGDLP